jgi:hypothetical protein
MICSGLLSVRETTRFNLVSDAKPAALAGIWKLAPESVVLIRQCQ